MSETRTEETPVAVPSEPGVLEDVEEKLSDLLETCGVNDEMRRVAERAYHVSHPETRARILSALSLELRKELLDDLMSGVDPLQPSEVAAAAEALRQFPEMGIVISRALQSVRSTRDALSRFMR